MSFLEVKVATQTTRRKVPIVGLPTAIAILLVALQFVAIQGATAAQPPTLTMISPLNGRESGGTLVTLTGSGLLAATEVRFDGQAATFVTESDSKLLVAAPPGTGEVNVTVVSPGGASAAKPFGYFAGEANWQSTKSPRGGSPSLILMAEGACATAAPPPYCGRVLNVAGHTYSELWNPATGSWAECVVPGSAPSSTCPGPLGTSRDGHTATRLADGRVLVSGGEANPDADIVPTTGPGSAEIYDPTTGRWTPTGAPAVRRVGATATRLSDGKVLVVGGTTTSCNSVAGSCTPAPDSAMAPEIFDPANGRWASAASMTSAPQGRTVHTATLLRTGEVLVVGGSGSLTAVELFSPASGSWRAARPLPTGRSYHTATSLPDGTVLVAGGESVAGSYMASAEIYDPTQDQWSATGTMTAGRSRHTATALTDGKVLVTGLYGTGDDSRARTTEIHDPVTGTWRPTASMSKGGGHQQAVLLSDGRTMVAGGCCMVGDLAEIYSNSAPPPRIDEVAPRAGSTSGGTVTVRGNGLFPVRAVTFGAVPATALFSTESMLRVASPPHPQGDVELRLETPHGPATASFTYGPGVWRDGPPLRECSAVSPSCQTRAGHTATLLKNGRVLVAGGHRPGDLTPLASAQEFDPVSGRWTATASMSVARTEHTATLLMDGRILVVGGELAGANNASAPLPTAEVYDPKTKSWSLTAPMAQGTGRRAHTATLLQRGDVLVAGGMVSSSDPAARPSVDAVEVFVPSSGTWRSLAPLKEARQLHTATLLSDGRVLMAGGAAGCADPTGDLVPCALSGSFVGRQLRDMSSTEIYDPAWEGGSGRSTLGRPLGQGRLGHVSTLLSGPNCGSGCGKVLVAGGLNGGERRGLAGTEVFDPVTGLWSPTESLSQPRGTPSLTRLSDGRVLVAGSSPTEVATAPAPQITSAAEVYDPATGQWALAPSMSVARGSHSATLLDVGPCGDNCGSMLVVGGLLFGATTATDSTELYAPAPSITSLSPSLGPIGGGTTVTITGTRLAGAKAVSFGATPASSFSVVSDSQISAVAPAHLAGPVQVAVIGRDGQTSALIEPPRATDPPIPWASFFYAGSAGVVYTLKATAMSSDAVKLSFAAPDDGSTRRLATTYVVKQSGMPIDEHNFDAATSLCPNGKCVFDKQASLLELRVGDLVAETRYWYALKAVNALEELGPMSNVDSTTTLAAVPTAGACAAVGSLGADQSLLSGGRYRLVGYPQGTLVGSDAPLYSWLDAGAGGTYLMQPSSDPVVAGRGYWAWSACDRAVTLAPGGPNSVSLPLGAYHASMVGNPSATSAATVTGHDFAATWDPATNGGAGGYRISAYRDTQTVAVGEGIWTFAYAPTEIKVTAQQ